MRIEEFVGNNSLKNQIMAMFANKKIPHAIILEGEPGTGKKTFANIIANFAVCGHFSKGPCYECASCKKALNGIHPDIIQPEKSGVLQTINVAEVRRIKKDAYVVPNEAPYKIYIFTDVDNMGLQAQNSLLKILEEPPKNVIFIFTCVNLGNILLTVRSRAQVFKLESVNQGEAINFILKNYKDTNKSDIQEAARLSCGSIGKAIEILSEDKIKNSIILAEKVTNAIANLNDFEIMISLGEALEDKKELRRILNLIYLKVKDALLLCAGNKIEESKSEATFRLSTKMDMKKIVKILAVLDESMKLCDQNVNKELIITYVCSKLHEFVCN